MSDSAALKRQLKIKSGAVKRLMKEYGLYKKETEEQQIRVDKYIADGKDEYDIKNQKNILAESQKMIPDTQKRLATLVGELRDVVVSARQILAPEDEDLIKADEALEEASI